MPTETPGLDSKTICETLKRKRKPSVILPGQNHDEKAATELQRLQETEIGLAQQIREKNAEILQLRADLEEANFKLGQAKETIALLEKDATTTEPKKGKGKKTEQVTPIVPPNPVTEPIQPQEPVTPPAVVTSTNKEDEPEILPDT